MVGSYRVSEPEFGSFSRDEVNDFSRQVFLGQIKCSPVTGTGASGAKGEGRRVCLG